MLTQHLTMREIATPDGKTTMRTVGPGPAQAHVLLDQPRDMRTIRSVIATLPGESANCVIAGAHRDAWVRGANDDGSGVVAMIRAAQRLSERVKAGWKPANSIIIALWDAEEFGMIGSTEWAEAHAVWLKANCFAYVNSDTGVSGTHFRGASGTPGMLGVLRAALERVPAAEAGADGAPRTLWDDWLASLKSGEEPAIEPAGSGSDFAVFLHHLNRPVVDVSLSGNRGGQYHTTFDDFAFVERYLDPGFVGHELCGRLLDELLAEMADKGWASFDAFEAALALSKIAKNPRNLMRTGDKKPWLGIEQAYEISKAFEDVAGICRDAPHTTLYELLAFDDGIPGREWYTNPVWAPGLEDGYGSEFFPVLRAGGDGSGRLRFDDVGLTEYILDLKYLLGYKPAKSGSR